MNELKDDVPIYKKVVLFDFIGVVLASERYVSVEDVKHMFECAKEVINGNITE